MSRLRLRSIVVTTLIILLSVYSRYGQTAESDMHIANYKSEENTIRQLLGEAIRAEENHDRDTVIRRCATILSYDHHHQQARALLVKIGVNLSYTIPSKILTPLPIIKEDALIRASNCLQASEFAKQTQQWEKALYHATQSLCIVAPYAGDPRINAFIQATTALAEQCAASVKQGYRDEKKNEREQALHQAVVVQKQDDVQQQSLLNNRINRVKYLHNKGFDDEALKICRWLVRHYSERADVQNLYAQILDSSYARRKLDREERQTELMQEIQLRIEKSMIPFGFDGAPDFPQDWEDRRKHYKTQLTPPTLPEWHIIINQRLKTTVSLHCKDLSAKIVFQNLAQLGNINIVIDPSVTVKDQFISADIISMSIENVLTWVCHQAQTHWSIVNNAVYIGGDKVSESIIATYDVSEVIFPMQDQKPTRLLGIYDDTQQQPGLGGGIGANPTFGGSVDTNADALAPEDLIDVIQKSISPPTWDDPKNGIKLLGNTLYVTAPTEVHLLINNLLHQFSYSSKLAVRVDGRWLTIADDYLEEIGVEWNSPANGLLTFPQAEPSGFHGNSNHFDHNGSLTNILPSAETTPVPDILGTGLNLSATLLDAVQLSAALTAVERTRKGEVLNEINLVTFSGVRAFAFFGYLYTYLGDYEVGTGNVGAGLTPPPDIGPKTIALGGFLDVKPFVSSDEKYVTIEYHSMLASLRDLSSLDITVFQSQPVGFDPNANNGVGAPVVQISQTTARLETPWVHTDRVHTYAMVPDGGTVLVGGYGEYVEQHMSSHVPFLGHIPFIGRLFGKRGRYSERLKLYASVTVNIIKYKEFEDNY